METENLNWSLYELRILLHLHRTGSLSETARHFGISQPAISQKLKFLEKQLRVPLWQRRGRSRGSLTKAGRVFLDYTVSIFRQTDDVLVKLGAVKPHPSIHIAASTIPGERLLPGAVAQFRSLHPEIAIRVEVMDSAMVVNRVRNKEADMGICGKALPFDDLGVEEVCGDSIVFAVNKTSPLTQSGKPITIAELEGHCVIMREIGSGTRATLENAMTDRSMTFPPNMRQMELGSTQAIVEAISQDIGCGFISNKAAAGLPTIVIEGLTPIPRTFYIIHNRNADLAESFIPLRDFLMAYFQDS
ncbi:LysR family transcriptional regulator [bacterium]|nr:LysR family transcriptional regulator [candidate division CSSED10-310 bacterium]